MTGRIIAATLCLSLFLVLSAEAAPEIDFVGDLRVSGGGVIFSDGTKQNTALVTDGPARNTAAGPGALSSNTTGHNNTAVGEKALYANTTGFSNTALGAGALCNHSTGYSNTAVGLNALYSTTTGLLNTASGDSALYTNTSGNDNTAAGYYALFHNTTGNNNTAYGVDALWFNATGSDNTAVGYNADVLKRDLSNTTAVGYAAKVDISNKVRIGNDAVTVIGGKVGWSNIADSRAKKDIRDLSRGLAFITSLRPVEFRMNQGNERIDFGFLAQDVEALLGREYNMLGLGGDEARTLSLRYADFIAPLVKALQEQQQFIVRLQHELEELKTLVHNLASK